jgi:S-adenosylmethionine synthetase
MRDKGEFLFTSESVSEGHPDKVADRLSDTVLDAYLGADPYSRVACETLVTTNRVIFAGETRGPATVTSDLIHHLARMAIHDIGYDQDGFSWDKAEIACHLHAQSLDIAQGVDAAGNKDEGAGDQGMMFGYACRETKALMPAPIHYAHAILHRIRELRRGHDKSVHGLLPDAKSQVTLRYVDGKPVGATSVVVSTQHVEDLEQPEIKRMLWPIVKSTLPDGWMCPEAEFHVNPTGKFVTGGPDGDCGLTGRKIIVLRRWTVLPPMPAGIWRRTSSQPGWRIVAPSRSATRSASRAQCPCMSICRTPGTMWTRPVLRRRYGTS